MISVLTSGINRFVSANPEGYAGRYDYSMGALSQTPTECEVRGATRDFICFSGVKRDADRVDDVLYEHAADLKMTRFMMSLKDAVEFVLFAYKNGNQGGTSRKKCPK